MTLAKLFSESSGVQETFVEYSLHSITARFGWVPIRKVLIVIISTINQVAVVNGFRLRI